MFLSLAWDLSSLDPIPRGCLSHEVILADGGPAVGELRDLVPSGSRHKCARHSETLLGEQSTLRAVHACAA